jgi:chaperonin GroEL (HSP60 family)
VPHTAPAAAIVAEGVRSIAAGASAIDLKRGLDRAARIAIDSLRSQSRSVQSQREKEQVATISAHNDPTIGELVAQAIEKAGAEGAVTVEEAKGTETTMEVAEGLLDPTKVVRLALENAVSVAGVLLLTEATTTEVPETKAEREPVGAEAGL